MALLLFIAESVPSFGSILNLVGGSTITCLTFIMPPLLYIFVMDHSEIRYLTISDLNLLSERWTFTESEFYVTRLKSLSEKKKAVLTMVYTLMLLHVLLGLNVRQINLVWDIKSSLKGKLMLYLCMYKN